MDGVLVNFTSTDGGVIQLGDATSGSATTWTDGKTFIAQKGLAAVEAQPYRIGTWSVTASVESGGTGNVVTLEVTGT